MRRFSFLLTVFIAGAAGVGVGSYVTLQWLGRQSPYPSIELYQRTRLPVDTTRALVQSPVDLQEIAERITPAVVHVRTTYGPGQFSINALEHYFRPHAQSSGSGVLVTDDGYVVTNFHVIESATSIEVVLSDNHRFFARLVGTDPSTDLALLKIKARGLSFMRYGDSDRVRLGDWVMAIGNPFDLNSTVTAGIVSGRARNIGILRDRNSLQVESFLQTDAAVNPGNSGGALVNLQGELIGINTAIATHTGSYSGYSFAIPVNLVKKVVDDLLEFGTVQRGLLGVQIIDLSAALAEERDLPFSQGVLVRQVNSGSGAERAGILPGDVILEVNRAAVHSVSELQERVARYRPGHTLSIQYFRGGRKLETDVVLRDLAGTDRLKVNVPATEWAGGRFANLSARELGIWNLDGGVRLTHVEEGNWKEAGIPEQFIITHIDKVPVDDLRSLADILSIKSGSILVEGLLPAGQKKSFGVEW